MNNRVIVGLLCVIAIALGAWLYFGHPYTPRTAAPTTQAVITPQNVSFNVLDSGMDAKGMPSRANYAIYTADEFANFWKQAHDNDGTTPPVIDFSQEYVIGVFAGTEPSTGYSIAVAQVSDSGDTRSVTVNIAAPGTDCQTVTQATSPYEFVAVPFSNATTLAHTDEQMQKSCTQ